MKPHPRLVSLGANLPSPAGEPRATLEAALAALEARGVAVAARSAWWRSPAFPPGSGPDFVNGAVAVETDLAPAELLDALHSVEHGLGRERPRRWAPRACDLDLLACGETVAPDRGTVLAWMRLDPADQAERAPEDLILPHPRLHERGFVLRPLAEIASDWVHPLVGRSVREMLTALPRAALEGLTRI